MSPDQDRVNPVRGDSSPPITSASSASERVDEHRLRRGREDGSQFPRPGTGEDHRDVRRSQRQEDRGIDGHRGRLVKLLIHMS